MDPWKSWAIVGVVGAGAAYYYSQSGKSKRGRGRAAMTLVDQNQQRASNSQNNSGETRKKKGKAKASDASDQAVSDAADVSSASLQTSPSERAKKRKGGKQQPSKLAQSSAVEASKEREMYVADEQEEDEGMSNAEFAQQLLQLKTGTSLRKPATTNEAKKTRKQGKRNDLPQKAPNGGPSKMDGIVSSQDMSTASSTAGADADDDLSLPVSPDIGATEATTPSVLDVSDMLGPPAKGPSVLRLTEPVNQQRARQPKPPKAAPDPETKKQRQNRKKNEEKKAMREQAETERRILLEKQRRTAREAEGRPARNDMGTSNSPSTNAWSNSTSAATGSEAPTPTPNNGALLDTLEESTTTIESSAKDINGLGVDTVVDGRTWSGDLPSEEEQLRALKEMASNNAWSTVPSGKGRKRSAVVGAGTGVYKAEPSGSKMPSSDIFAPSYTTSQALHKIGHQDDMISTEAEQTTASTDNAASFVANEPLDANEIMALPNTSPLGLSVIEDKSREQFGDYEDYMEDWRKTKWSDGRFKAEDPAGDVIIDTKTTPSGRKRVIKKRPRRPKATCNTIDHSVWTYDNIKKHPDYDPRYHFALTGHPADSEWDGGHGRAYFHVYHKDKDYYDSDVYSSDAEGPINKAPTSGTSTTEKSNNTGSTITDSSSHESIDEVFDSKE